MMICRIDGAVHGTVQDPSLEGTRLLIAQPLSLDGVAQGPPMIAIDRVAAGPGDLVLVMREGGSARMILGDDKNPVQALIIAVIDDVQMAE